MNDLVLGLNYVMGKMRRVFFMAYPENAREYKKSRICYTISDSAAQTIAQLAGGTFLVALMEEIGFSDGSMGIIASFGYLAAFGQIISIKLANKITKNKLFACLTVLQKLWLAFIFFIPLLGMRQNAEKVIMIVAFLFAQTCVQIGTPAIVDWIASLVPAKFRGRYFSVKDSIAVFVVVTVMLVLGILLDVLKQINIYYALVLLGTTIAVLAIINFAGLLCMKEPKHKMLTEDGKEPIGKLAKRIYEKHAKKQDVQLITETKIAFGDVKFRKLLIFNCLWMTAMNISYPFNSSFQVKDMQLPYTYIMVLSFVTSMVRIYITPKAGRMADKIGMGKVTGWSLMAIGGYCAFMFFVKPENAYVLVAVATLFSVVGWAFVGTGMFGIQLELLREEKRIIQYSLLSLISGVYAFFVSLVGGKLVDFVQRLQLVVGGNKIYAQQCTNLLGVIFVVVTIIYLKKSIEPSLER